MATRFQRASCGGLDLGTGVGAAAIKPGAGPVVTFQVAGPGGVPSTGAPAVVFNVTITEASGAGFVQVFPTGSPKVGDSSNLNVARAGQTTPNLVVVPLGGRGQLSIYTQSGGHVLADVFGYSAAARSSDGLFVPWTPPRVLNTRFKLRWMRCLHGAANR